MVKIYHRFLSHVECEIALFYEDGAIPSKVGYEEDKSIQNTVVRKSFSWSIGINLCKHIESILNEVLLKEEYFQYKNLSIEEIQGLTYYEGCYFKDHSDNPDDNGRLITGIVMLSKLNDFSGGELNINSNNQIQKINLDLGDLVLFDSKLIHSVSEIIQGSRKVLVFWLYNL